MASKSTLPESVDEATSSTAAAAVATPKRMGVVRYCQVRELSRSWTAVMKNRYKSEVHTLKEWNELYEWVRNRKVGSI